MISEEDIRRVREATDLVALVSETVVLKQRGREYWGRCPFHEEKTPSFKVDPRSQLFHCFGCHAGGDAYGFVMRTEGMGFLDAVRYLADRATISLVETERDPLQGKRARLFEVMSASANFYATQLLRSTDAGAAAARSYLSGRAMGLSVAKTWHLGYAPGYTTLYDHLRTKGYSLEECLDANVVVRVQQGRLRDRFFSRVMFPVADLQGRIIAFGGRTVDGSTPKYLNTAETPLFHKREALYALDKAKARIASTGTAIVVEGYTDTIAMHAAGFTNTVATLGTALTKLHIKTLDRYAKQVVYLFDGDEAGKRAAVRAAELITRDATPEAGTFRVVLCVAELPPGVDPAELLAEQGSAAMQECLDRATPLISYALRQSIQGAELSSHESRIQALHKALPVLLPIRGSLLANTYIQDELAPLLGMDYDEALREFNLLQSPEGALREEKRSQVASATAAGADLQSELILLYIEHPEVRSLLAKAFEKIAWSSDELTQLAHVLLGANHQMPGDELYALVLAQVPACARMLSAGLKQNATENAADYAHLLMYMLREKQLENEIALAKIAYANASARSEKDVRFKETAEKQSELALIRERLAQIPKKLA